MREIKSNLNANELGMYRKVSFRNRIGRIVGLSKKKATVLFDKELETVDKEDLELANEDFDEKEKVRVLIEGDFYDGFIVKKLKNNVYIVVVNGNQFKTSGEWLDKIKSDLGFFDSKVDLSKGKDESRNLWIEPKM